jgi:carboxymethylenebutenolidase
MILHEEGVIIETPTGPMYSYLFRPAARGSYPGLLLFSEIYQVTGPIQRAARVLAGQGYLVVAPEVYHEFEPPHSPFAYDEHDTEKGNRYKVEKEVSAFDSDARAALDHLRRREDCTGRLGCMGICLGGHLSFRAAMNEDVLAGACLYATDIHQRSLGKGKCDDSLDRIPEIQGELLMIWGRQDPHVDRAGRELIHKALDDAGVCCGWHEFNARHAFIRDEGYRYDPGLARICFEMVFELFHRRLQLGETDELAGPPGGGGPSC